MSDADDQVILQSSDGQEFRVKVEAVKCSVTIQSLIEDSGTDAPIPLPNVAGRTLSKVIKYCVYHFQNPESPPSPSKDDPSRPRTIDDISEWDQEFCNMDQAELFDLIMAANFLDISSLLDLTCKMVAKMIRGKTPDEIRRVFGLPDDLDEAEKEAIRAENAWCEEK